MLQLSRNPLLFFLEHQESLPPCIYHIHWNAKEVLLFLDKIMPICKSLASSKREEGPTVTVESALPHFTKERVKLHHPGGRRLETWCLQKHCSSMGAFLDVLCQPATFKLHPSTLGLLKAMLRKKKKGSSNLFFSQMQHWSTKNTFKYTSYHIYHLIHHQVFRIYHGGVGSCTDLVMESRGNSPSWQALLQTLTGDKSALE